VLRGVGTLLLCACANGAAAQVSGTLSAVSDYRYRGVTFSDRNPALQAGIAYDAPPGWYAGLFGSTVRLAPPLSPIAHFQAIAYAGYAIRLPSGVSVEAGGAHSAFSGNRSLDYGEVFLGAATENASARIYYSPKYFGQSSSAVYGEINGSPQIVDRVRLLLHAGMLQHRYTSPYGTLYGVEPTSQVFDARIGVRIDLDLVQLEIAWVGVSNHSAAYLFTGRNTPNGVVVALSHAF